MSLPKQFLERMESILENDFSQYLAFLEGEIFRAARVNTLKADADKLNEFLPFFKEPTAFCKTSYYIPSDIKGLGNHPLHHAGAFYIQEPSAASVVEAAEINEGDYVLDLCAAPGGKSTAAACKIGNSGLLISNEYVYSRVKPLVSNIERMGIKNAIVTSARPDVLCSNFKEFFDKVIVDAPCSGEGMFRKESAAIENWSLENVLACAKRQLEILNSAANTVKKGGKLIYSTCTYAPEENEQVIAKFLEEHSEFVFCDIANKFGQNGIEKFAPNTKNIAKTRRIFNFDGGEGHFVAVLRKCGNEMDSEMFSPLTAIPDLKCKQYKIFSEFFKENFKDNIPQNVYIKGDEVYITMLAFKSSSFQIIRSGIFAGTIKKDRFVPEHALFNTPQFNPERVVDIKCDSEEIKKYLHGEEIACDASFKGYVAVKTEGIPLGFGKASNGVLKNHYPKGLRLL